MKPSIRKIMGLSNEFRKGAVMFVGVKLGIFDQFDIQTPKDSSIVCKELEIDEDYGFRWIRALASIGFLEDHGERKFTLTEAGKCLRRDQELPLWRTVHHQFEDGQIAPYLSKNIMAMLSEGDRPSFDILHGENCWDYMEKHDDERNHFNETMKVYSIFSGPIYKDLFSQISHFKDVTTVCDIGGGSGALLNQILDMDGNSHLQGMVMDLESCINDTEKLMIHDRLKFVAGDMFDSSKIPAAEVYTLKSIIHDWNEENSIKILKTISEVETEKKKRVILVERIVAEKVNEENGMNIMLDIHMMVNVRGKERTESEWKDLLEKSGWKFEEVIVGDNPHRVGLIIGSSD